MFHLTELSQVSLSYYSRKVDARSQVHDIVRLPPSRASAIAGLPPTRKLIRHKCLIDPT
jgi:hypothetical protein